MRIAIPVTGGEIANHPGHCETFLVADVEGGAIVSERSLPNPGHGSEGPPPVFLANQGVTQLLGWGMPEHAREKFAMLGIKIQLGAKGNARQALQGYLAGTLQYASDGLDAGDSCEGHSHEAAPQAPKKLDVREIAPRDRHRLIFEAFEGLGADETFQLVNDHDPKPLYYTFEAEKKGKFTWDYLEQGPAVWRVRIGKTPAA